jgi:hypothetical protein
MAQQMVLGILVYISDNFISITPFWIQLFLFDLLMEIFSPDQQTPRVFSDGNSPVTNL